MKYFICFFLLSFSKNVYSKNDLYSRTLRKTMNVGGRMTGYVVGGVEVPISMYPYVVHITLKDKVHCGGVIVGDRSVVTAGHCTLHYDGVIPAKYLDVYMGSDTRKRGARYKVCKVIPHEKFDTEGYFYDIGMLILRRKIIFGPLVQKAIIAPDFRWRNTKYTLTVAGFGSIETDGIPSNKLKATRMHFVDSETCNKSQHGMYFMEVPNHMFCMIGLGWTGDCYGDSGSAVSWRKYLVGLVATGRDSFCGSDVMPSMYTDVLAFRDWIDSKIETLETLPLRSCEPLDNNKKNKKLAEIL